MAEDDPKQPLDKVDPDEPLYGASSAHPWISWEGRVAHPNARAGGGGLGGFKDAEPLGSNLDLDDPSAHPRSPAARYVALTDEEKESLKKQKALADSSKAEEEKPEELSTEPTCGNVVKVWDVTARRTTPQIKGSGSTLAALKANLNASQGDHWGEGGGELTIDEVKGVFKPGDTFTVTLRGEFINRIPEWTDRNAASDAAKKEWDRFIGKLKAHEECHVTIARKAFEALATEYPGTKITKVNELFKKRKGELAQAQKDLDDVTNTDHGRKSGVPCGDALLDATIT